MNKRHKLDRMREVCYAGCSQLEAFPTSSEQIAIAASNRTNRLADAMRKRDHQTYEPVQVVIHTSIEFISFRKLYIIIIYNNGTFVVKAG